jgi:peptide-methionine (S)-S-oxide reductase
MKDEIETIVLGGGCFWCTEAVIKMLRGVVGTYPGYAGGTVKNPTYEQVCTGKTGHAEVLRIEYDSEKLSLRTLLEVFVTMHDPTSVNRQGPDSGNQYRSIILYSTEEQKKEITAFLARAQKDFKKPIATQVRRLDVFYPAEEYHKDYYQKNPFQPYCLLEIGPKVAKVKKKFASLMK